MPKQNRMAGKKVLGKKTMKFRIGNRRNGRPAHELTNEELRAALGGRDTSKALAVLRARGVSVEALAKKAA